MQKPQDIVDVQIGSGQPIEDHSLDLAPKEVITQEQIDTAKQPEAKPVDMDQMAGDVSREMVKGADTSTTMALNTATFLPGIAEDVYNFGTDLINFTNRKFGGENFLEYSDQVSRWQPQDTGSVMARESAKMILGYSKILKGMSAMSPQGVAKLRLAADGAAGFMSELILMKPEGEPILKSFLDKVPVADEFMDYLYADEYGKNFENRLRNSLFGVVEGGLVDGVMKVAKVLRRVYKADDSFLRKMFQSEEGAVKGGGDGPTTPKQEPQVDDIPKIEEVTPPPVPTPMDTQKAQQVFERYQMRNADPKTLERAGIKRPNPNEASVLPDEAMNLTSLNVDDDLRQMTSAIVEANQESFARMRVDSPEIVQAARDLNMTPQGLLDMEIQAGFPRGTIVAAQALMNEAAGSLSVMAKRYNEGALDQRQWTMAVKNFEKLAGKVKDLRSFAGAILQETQVPIGTLNNTKKIEDLTRMFGDNADELAKELTRPNTTKENIMEAYGKWSIRIVDALTQIRYAGLLSSPATHLRNIYGGVSTTLIRPAETLLAATYNAITPGQKGVQFGEAYHETLGSVQGFIEAIQITGQRLKGNVDVDFMGVDPRHAKLPQFLAKNTDSTTKYGKSLGFMTEMLGTSKIGKALQMEDNFIKHINARMTLNKEAYKKGFEARLKALGEGKTTAEINDAVQKAIQKEKIQPSAATQHKMYQDAEYATFTNDVSGPILESLESMGNTKLGRIVAPFAKVNLNVMSYTLERLPGFNLTMKKTWSDLLSKNPELRQRAIAKASFSSATLGVLAFHLHSQDAIIGTGSTNPQKRKFLEQNGYQEGSIRVGDKWYEIRKETPLGAVLAFMADVAVLRDALPEREQHVTAELGKLLVGVVAQQYNPEFMTEAVTDLSKIMEGSKKEAGKAAALFAGKLASSYLPYSSLARQVNRYAVGDGTKSEVYTPASTLNTIMNQVKEIYAPYLNARKRNLLGDPIMHKQGLGPDIISPIGLTVESKDIVVKEIARLSDVTSVSGDLGSERELGSGSVVRQPSLNEAVFSMPPKTLTDELGQPIALGTDDYEKFVLHCANVPFKEGPNGLVIGEETSTSLRNVLKNIVESGAYKNSADTFKVDMLKKTIQAYRAVGKARLLNDSGDFSSAYKAIRRERLKEIQEVYR